MSLLGWFTGDNKNVGSVIDGVKSGLDSAFYTEQEKAEADKKILDFTLEYLKVTANQSMPRRVLAFGTFAIWALFLILAVAFKLFNNEADSKFMFDILKDIVFQPHSLIMSFYFLVPSVNKLRQ